MEESHHRGGIVKRSRQRVLACSQDPGRASVLIPHALGTLTLILIAAYVVGLKNHGPDFEPIVDGGLGISTELLPALACWLAVPSAGQRRREVAALALAVTIYAVGNTYYVLLFANNPDVAFPSPADVAFIAFYPLSLIAMALAVRRELRRVGTGVWLDCLLGGLGAAAVMAVLLDRLFTQASGKPLAGSVALVYPIGDLLLCAAVIGVVAMQGRQLARHWVTLLAGFAVFATVDTLSALSLFDETYAVGGVLDALWPIGLTLMSYWCRAKPGAATRVNRQAALLLPVIATLTSLTVLVAASRDRVSLLAVALATLTQVATVGRTQFAFVQLRRLADLRRQATTDELTSLPNRRAFYARAEVQIAVAGADQALLLLDLDRFKEVNDSLGHHVGDQLLIEIGRRLGEELRDGDLLARLGGDEFAVLLQKTTLEQAVEVAVKLRRVIAEPCVLEGIALRTDASIGLALTTAHGNELSLLLRHADIAMYKAKKAREGHRVYSAVDDNSGTGRLRALQELHTALVEGQMTLHYQPKLDLASNQVKEVEALVRWNHPDRGLLYPDSFLALVEDAGLMRALTQIVLEQALDQAAIWRAEGRPLTVAVNLSASSLVDMELPEQIADLLTQRGLPPGALQIEITEEFLMADRDRTREILTQLREAGIEIAVDDFGTGYSSLAYLRELPIDELKLDRSFVFPMAGDPRAAALVYSTIGLAHSLGLRLVAEGVEDETSLRLLDEHGCDQAQGYFISRPVPAATLDSWLDQRPDPPTGSVTSRAAKIRW
jgi:diguanylate cyclase (GGDEF)-like protein